MTTGPHTDPPTAPVRAWIVLPGHRDVHASVDVLPCTAGARIARTLMLAALWSGTTAAMFFITIFDPFMTSMPALVGIMAVYRSWKGRYRVRSFRGGCPRCGTELQVKRGSRISVPHPLVCYACHHEPELVFERAA